MPVASVTEAATATIRDVAREAGVSVATVSRVYNNSGLVHEATRRRVEAVATRLEYAPHAAARSLITSRTSTVGVLLPDLYGEFFSELLRGMDRAARKHGFHLLVSSSHDDRASLEEALQSMWGRVDGLVVMAPSLHLWPTRFPQRLPVVLVGSPAGDAGFASVRMANFQGAYDMVRHLLAHGHRRVGLIRGPLGNADADERRQGYRAALQAAGLEPLRADEVTGTFRKRSGYEAAARLFSRPSPPTAVFVGNDAMAIGALAALRRVRLRVPADVAVAGFDDIPTARYVHPPLSTVRVSIHELGRRAVGRLLEKLGGAGDGVREAETVAARLLIRRSCGNHREGRPVVRAVE